MKLCVSIGERAYGCVLESIPLNSSTMNPCYVNNHIKDMKAPQFYSGIPKRTTPITLNIFVDREPSGRRNFVTNRPEPLCPRNRELHSPCNPTTIPLCSSMLISIVAILHRLSL
jgi:hypothetical protein